MRNARAKLVDMVEAVITVANNVVVDSVQALNELKELQCEIEDAPVPPEELYTRLVTAITKLGHQHRKTEDDIDQMRTRMTRMIQFYNREFAGQYRCRELIEVERSQPQGEKDD